MFEWKQSYSVGVASVDAQHQNLFRLASELYTAMSTGQGKSAMSRTLDRLVDYTEAHFAHEERLMKDAGYKDYDAHAKEHAALTQKVRDFQREFKEGRVAMSVAVLNFLRTWLQTHIQGSDLKYVPYVKAKAVA